MFFIYKKKKRRKQQKREQSFSVAFVSVIMKLCFATKLKEITFLSALLVSYIYIHRGKGTKDEIHI